MICKPLTIALSILGGVIMFCSGAFIIKNPEYFSYVNIVFSLFFIYLIYKIITLWNISKLRETEIENEIQKEKEKVLKGYNSYVNQLSNIIAGLNHEVSPWMGSIQNKITRLKEKTTRANNPLLKRVSDENIMTPGYLLKKLSEIEKASETAIHILKSRSYDVKKLQNYSISKSNIFDTIETWVHIAMVDSSVKGDISSENIYIHFESLNFEVDHSPLLISQVILNLVKNSVEHNTHMLENLLISISGDSARNCIIYEDNGKGIPDDKIESIFEPGITSKKHEKEIHGLGLSLCLDYCECMGATIKAEKSKTGAKFVIYFNKIV